MLKLHSCVVVAAAVAVIAFAGVAAARPHHKRAHKRAHAATARLHKRARPLPHPPAAATPSDALEPQLQISAPHAAAEPAPEPATAATVTAAAPTMPPTAPPQNEARVAAATPRPPARLDLTPPASAAPAPAVLLSAPVARRAPSDLQRQRRWGLFGGGVAMFLIGYGADIGITYGLNHQPSSTSLVPFAGPLVQLRDSWAVVAPTHTGNPQIDDQANPRIAAVNAEVQTAAYAVLAVDCAIQLVGAGLAVAGVVGHTRTRFASIEPAGGGVRVRF